MIDEIKKRWAAATPGPWCHTNAGDKCNDYAVLVMFSHADEDCEHPLSGYQEISEYNEATDEYVDNYIDENVLQSLGEWRKNPGGWMQ